MDRSVAEPFVTKHLYVFYCMFAWLCAGDNITDRLAMTDSYSTEDAERSGVGLSPLHHLFLFTCNASSKMFSVHRQGAHGRVLRS